MKLLPISFSFVICAGCLMYVPSGISQNGVTQVDWREELNKAEAQIKRNPKSAFWHGQAGIAYDGLKEKAKAERELKLAARLDPTNPVGYYILYGFYQRTGTLSQQRMVLLSALEIDSRNPLGHFELGAVLQKERYLPESLREYRTAKQLISSIDGNQYTDPRSNPYDIVLVRREVANCIETVLKLEKSEEKEKP